MSSSMSPLAESLFKESTDEVNNETSSHKLTSINSTGNPGLDLAKSLYNTVMNKELIVDTDSGLVRIKFLDAINLSSNG